MRHREGGCEWRGELLWVTKGDRDAEGAGDRGARCRERVGRLPARLQRVGELRRRVSVISLMV